MRPARIIGSRIDEGRKAIEPATAQLAERRRRLADLAGSMTGVDRSPEAPLPRGAARRVARVITPDAGVVIAFRHPADPYHRAAVELITRHAD